MEANFTKLEQLKFKKVVKMYKILYNQYTLKIIELLLTNNMLNVKNIQDALNITQSQTSQYLGRLRKSLLVLTIKKRNIVYYTLNKKQFDHLNNLADQVINVEKNVIN